MDVLQQLVNQVQIGSQGPQVMMVQDSMNRFQNVEPASGNSLTLLAVDGQFGPKTNTRVKGFQTKNNLVPDGVVGPITRNAIKSKAQMFPTA